MARDYRPPPSPLAEGADSAPEQNGNRDRDRAELLAALARAPWNFGFCHTLRRFDCLQPERPRIGATARPSDDPIRFGQQPSLRFAPSELAALEQSGKSGVPRLLVYFLGLLGPNGPLPLHLTEYARDRRRNAGDRTFARFLDSFHHRMLSLFYRAWAQAQPAVGFDRPEQDRFAAYLGHLSGTGTSAFRNRDAMSDLARHHYAGHLASHTRHPDGLRSMLTNLLGFPVRIREFVGHWLTLPSDCQLRLGDSPESGALGRTTTLGRRVWDHQTRFRVQIGPVKLVDYESLLPGGEALACVKAVVRNYVGDQLDWDLNPVLARVEVPPLKLGSGVRLGWTTWITSGLLERDGDDLKLDPFQ